MDETTVSICPWPRDIFGIILFVEDLEAIRQF
jgi:hypothetical protein